MADNYNCSVKAAVMALVVMVLFLTGCQAQATASHATEKDRFITATLPASPESKFTAAPSTPTPSPSPQPIAGTTTTQVNVRAEPRSSATVLGTLGASVGIGIVGKDPGGNWYQIPYEQGAEGLAWVASEYVRVRDRDGVPYVGGGGPNAAVIERINVRMGPATSYESVGTLEARDAVTLMGRDSTGTWLQIKFAAGPDGKGWVAGSFLEATAAEGLPVVSDSGESLGTVTPPGKAPTPMPTGLPASEDDDSAENPAANVLFGPGAAGSFFYAGDVSVPEGDPRDWLGFTSFWPSVTVAIACTGNGTLSVDLLPGEASTTAEHQLSCGDNRRLRVSAGRPYRLRLSAVATTGGLQFVHYTVSVYGAR